jgi:hypothetical protein
MGVEVAGGAGIDRLPGDVLRGRIGEGDFDIEILGRDLYHRHDAVRLIQNARP